MTVNERARAYLNEAEKFQLGELATEKPHPLTGQLSFLAQNDINEAIKVLQKVDSKALDQFSIYLPELEKLQHEIERTLQSGHRIFLCGCGATGRLSLTLEAIWRELWPESNQICAFMAGGDVALVHAIEGFEDFPEYGAKQLMELGFSSEDLLIACTEGGETPFVLGAVRQAIQVSQRKPFFLYCNLRETLVNSVGRSREILTDPAVRDICLFVGPMAIAGSTRMQASTVLQLAVGLALFLKPSEWKAAFNRFTQFHKMMDISWLQDFICFEAEIYQRQEYIHYLVEEMAITVFTDTTERAPTFSLQAFNHLVENRPQSLSYIAVNSTVSSEESWLRILRREPHSLGWPNGPLLTKEYLLGFDFSR